MQPPPVITSEGREYPVNIPTENGEAYAAVAVLASGGYVIAWEGGNGGDDLFGRIFDKDGGLVSNQFELNTVFGGRQANVSLAGLPDGGFIAVWDSNMVISHEIVGQRFDALGNKVGGEFQINTTTASEQTNPHVVALKGGGFVVTWDTIVDDLYEDVRAQVFDAGGQRAGAEILVNTAVAGQQGLSTVTDLPNGGFAVAYRTDARPAIGTLVQKFDLAGRKDGSELLAGRSDGWLGGVTDIDSLDDGSLVVTWIGNFDAALNGGHAAFRLIDPDGTLRGADQRTLATMLPYQGAVLGASVVADTGSDYVFLLSIRNAATNTTSVKAMVARSDQVSWSAGVELNGDGLPSRTVTLDGAAILPHGRMVVAWHGPSPDDGQGISHIRALVGHYDLASSESDDKLAGGANADWIDGLGGNDVIEGFLGNDVIFGGAGDDIIDGGPGSDTIDGGPGTDTVTYAKADNGPAGIALAALTNGGWGNDTLRNVENVIGTIYHDVIFGTDGTNVIDGGSGNDTINGSGGDDDLRGGAGIDIAAFTFAASGVTVSLGMQGGAQQTGEGFDTLTGFESLAGSAFNDMLTGDDGANTLAGGDGLDVLYGGKGADVLAGGAGADYFIWHLAAESAASAPDIIADFAPGVDKLDLRGFLGSKGVVTFSTAFQYQLISVDQEGDGVIDMNILTLLRPLLSDILRTPAAMAAEADPAIGLWAL